jgi:hypothetical protein
VTLRLTAEHADAWNSFGPPDAYAAKNGILDEWCARFERNPRHVERTVGIQPGEIGDWQAYLDAVRPACRRGSCRWRGARGWRRPR